jgi:hypothetical protein
MVDRESFDREHFDPVEWINTTLSGERCVSTP